MRPRPRTPRRRRYNTEESIRGFAKSCFEYALTKQWCAPRPRAGRAGVLHVEAGAWPTVAAWVFLSYLFLATHVIALHVTLSRRAAHAEAAG